MDTSTLKPINTVFSVDSILEIKQLVDAKLYMNNNCGNKFTHIPPHIAYTIMPMPKKNFESAKQELISYIGHQKPFKVTISDLILEKDHKFFSIKITGDKLIEHHESITKMLNQYREGNVRAKDLERLNKGDFDEIATRNLCDFGYTKVMDRYDSHITVGNVTIENTDINKVEKTLRKLIGNILNSEYTIDNIHGVFHTDSANNQTEMEQIWSEVYYLK